MGRLTRLSALLVVCLVIWFASPALGKIVYVKWDSPTNGPGNDWDHAYHTVGAGLAAATSGDEVWVAGDAANPYVQRITLKAGVGLYGGFAGTETDRSQRDYRTNVTILEGNKAGAVVISPSGATTSTVIDGFTIQNGAATTNSGAGIYCSSSSPTIQHNRITENYGAAVGCSSASPAIINNVIIASRGVGLHLYSSSPTVVNNTIVGNSSNNGGGICCAGSGSSPSITSNIIAFNSSGICKTGTGTPYLRYNCIYNPSGYNYSGLSAGYHDIQTDPKFAALDYGEVHIQPDSPCRYQGDYFAWQPGWTDIDGQTRSTGVPDIGADQSDGTTWTFTPAVVRVSPSGNDSNDGSTWALAKRTVQAGINAASDQRGEVWVAAGTYYEHVALMAFAEVYGGFVGTEDVRDERNWSSHTTVLDGGGTDAAVGAVFGHLVSRIDGFTVRNGGAYTAGIVCDTAAAVVANCTITANVAGGIDCSYSSPMICNSIITANSEYGIKCYSAAPTISNNTITGNSGYGVSGGGSDSAPKVYNNIIAFNSSGISYSISSGVLKHNCVYNPGGFDYYVCDPGVGDIQVDPKLVAVQYGQNHIQPDSPCIDAGDDTLVQSGWLDIDGQARVQGAHVDIGADESDGTSWTCTPRVVRVSPSGNDASDGSTWALAKRTVQAGIDAASALGGEVWVAAGTYNERAKLPAFVSLYGGFAGTEDSRDARGWASHVTVLDGGGTGHVVEAVLGHGVGRIDGFTVQNGDSGIYCDGSPTIANNTIRSNIGYGIYSSSASLITNNVITGNSYGIYCPGWWSTITNNTITGNAYGAYFNDYYYSPATRVANNIVAFNGSGLYCTANMANGMLKNNCVYNPGGTNYYRISAGASDLQLDPKLVSVQFGQLHIQPDSPCKDSGDDTVVQTGWLDIDGQSRIQGTHVDIGADESDGTTWTYVPSVVRVSPSGDDANDGSTWALAKRTVQAGINAASALGGEAWVAAGTYYERIILSPYAYLYGGFAGTESSRGERNWAAHVTVLDGSGAGSVVQALGGFGVSRIDGFTITNGTNGGIYCSSGSPTISNNKITSNRGGGISCHSRSMATICNNAITANTGGGIFCYLSSPTIANNTITANYATQGGGIYCDGSGSVPAISNNIVAFNSSGIYSRVTGPVLKKNCVYNPSGYNYSVISPGATDIQVDPKLVAVGYGELHIRPTSPCRNTGDDTVVQTGWLDIDGQARIQGTHVDIGADESDGTSWTYTPSVVRVSLSGNDANDGSTWALAKRSVQAGIDAAGAQGGEVWVASGTYNERVVLGPYTYIYGGFSGSETSRDSRNWTSHVTVLDGGAAGHVVAVGIGQGISGIDGFTVRNGTGGGIYVSTASPMISNNTVIANAGGGVYVDSASPVISNNTVVANTGGGIYVSSASPMTIANNTITGNSGTNRAGIYLTGSATALLAISNNIVAFNSSGIYNGSTSPVLKNNCVYNPSGNNYSGLSAGATDIQVDPKLVAVQYGDLHIQPDSPCRNTGDDTVVQSGWVDMDGQVRIQGTHVDIGADESDGTTWTYVPSVVRVSPSGDDANDGSTWALAKRTVQAGANAASAKGGELWIAAGTYAEHIILPPLVSVYGGFAGTETSRDQRDWKLNASVLDGGGTGNVVEVRCGRGASIDGFTIRNGVGGIHCPYSSPIVSNNTITGNSMGVWSEGSSPTIANNLITANTGRGIFSYNSSPVISGNVITGNNTGISTSAESYSCMPMISNNTITANSGEGISSGGGYSKMTLSNNIIAFNSWGIMKRDGTATLNYNCVYNPSGTNYSSGLAAGIGDISVDPLLTADYHLSLGSPCIDAGWDSAAGVTTFDMDGQRRVGGVIDIGADEYWSPANFQGVKSTDNATAVSLGNAMVTAAFMDFFYIESDDRTCGIRVNKTGHTLAEGMRAYVSGYPATHDSERCIDASDAGRFDSSLNAGQLEPLTLTVQSLGGGDYGLQPSIWGWTSLRDTTGQTVRVWRQLQGLNNIGLLVRICGKVVEVEPVTEPAVPTWFKVDDGTGASVKCLVPSGVTIDPNWDRVTVTGISSCETVGTEIHSLLRVRTQGDVVPH